jgi:hypothetical protein
VLEIQRLILSGAGSNPRLNALASEYCEKTFGAGSVDFKNFTDIWVVVNGGPGEIPEITGIMGLRVALDLALFHTENGSELKDKGISAKMIQRLRASVLDRGFDGQDMLLHVEPEKLSVWKELLEGMKSVPADRHLIKCRQLIEV